MEEAEQQGQMDRWSRVSNVTFQGSELPSQASDPWQAVASSAQPETSSQNTSMLGTSWKHSSGVTASEGQRSPPAASLASLTDYQLHTSPPSLGSQRSSIEKANWEWAWPWATHLETNNTLKMISGGPGVYLQGASVPNSPARRLSEWRRSSLQAEKQNMPKDDILKFLRTASAELMTRGDVDSIQQKETRLALRRLKLIPSRSTHRMNFSDKEDDADDLEYSSEENVRDSQWSLRHAGPQMVKARKLLRNIDRALQRSEVQTRILRNQELLMVMHEPSMEALPPVTAGRRSVRRDSVQEPKGPLAQAQSRWPAAVAAAASSSSSAPMHAMRRRRRSSQQAKELALAIQHAVHRKAQKLEAAVSKEALPPERLTYSYVLRKLRPVAGDAVPSEEEGGAATHDETVSWVGLDADVPMPGMSRRRQHLAAASGMSPPTTSTTTSSAATTRAEQSSPAATTTTTATTTVPSGRRREQRRARRPARQRRRSQALAASSSSSSERSSLASTEDAPDKLLARVLKRVTTDNSLENTEDLTWTASPLTSGRFYSPLNVPFYKLPPSTLQQLAQARRGVARM